MANPYHIENDTVAGTIGGTFLALLPHLETTEISRTLVLGALGAVASFVITQLCKWIWNTIKKQLLTRRAMRDTKRNKNDKEQSD